MWPGRFWVETRFYDSGGNIMVKPDWLIKLYEQCAKWIKKNYRISKCKGYYIGEKAYLLYSQEGWQMQIGPSLYAEF